jgi:hypothetical protein
MNRNNNRRKALWITIFVLLIGISGLGLAASGNFENPLGALNDGSGGGEHRGAPPSGGQPPQGAGQRDEEGSDTSITWSAIGGVLYNVWFLFAAAAVVIVVQTVGGGIWQKVRQRVPKTASP